MIKTNTNLYEMLDMKRKNSIFKSVFITGRSTSEGYRIVEVEAYDDTFLNATQSVNQYDKTVGRIMKKLCEVFKGEDIWLIIYTDNFGQSEILVNDNSLKRYELA